MSKVNFLGVFPNYKIPVIINQYILLILPSFFEGNPKALLEAMSCKIPCIGTNIRGIKDVITHLEKGYLVESSSKLIENAIQELYKNHKLREKIRKNICIFVKNICFLDSIIEKELILYKGLVLN